jgi:sialic acid synthase SpsE
VSPKTLGWCFPPPGGQAAAASGADAVKFQTYSSNDLYSSNTPDFAGYRNIPELIKSIELPREWHKDLKILCDDSGIEFMSTPFDERAVDELVNVGMKRIKIASFESKDRRLLKCVAKTGLPVIFSAGVGTSSRDVSEIIDFLLDEGSSEDITVLHCNSAYPTPFEDICLRQIEVLIFDHAGRAKIGFSDHTTGILAPPVAVALGASVVEKHYTLDRTMKGPDHPFAIEPDELVAMVRNIRTVEKMLRPKTGMTESESSRGMWQALRSVVLARPVKAGSILTKDDLTTKRPFLEGAVPAEMYFQISDKRTAASDMEADHILKWNDLT